jgi:hypothetical protein
VERERDHRDLDGDRAAVDGDPLPRRIGALPERRDPAIDGDATVDDQRLDGAAAAEPGAREQLLQALRAAVCEAVSG